MMSLTHIILVTVAGAGTPTNTVGYYDPYAPFSSPLERANFAVEFAKMISSGSSGRFRGEAFSKPGDLTREIKSGRVRFALVNPQFLVTERPTSDLQPFLVGTRKGSSHCPYALFISKKSRARNLTQLRRKRLAIVRTGSSDERFIYNTVLRGELRDFDFFSELVRVPDLAGAVGTLRFDRADAFFGPDISYRKRFKTRALRKVAHVGSTLCVVMVTDPQTTAAERRTLSETISQARPKSRSLLEVIGIDGFTEIQPDALEQLAISIHADPVSFARAEPLYLTPDEPNEGRILKIVKSRETGTLPAPSQFIVERDGP